MDLAGEITVSILEKKPTFYPRLSETFANIVPLG
jgi:hypothetical protein